MKIAAAVPMEGLKSQKFGNIAAVHHGTHLLLCEEDEIRQYLFPERSCRCSGDAAPRLRLFEQDRIGLYFIPERSWRGGASSPRFVGGVALRRVQSGLFSSDFISWLIVFSSTKLGTGKIRWPVV